MTGGCLCGAVRYDTGAPPIRVGYCYCRHCRNLSGAPVAGFAEFGLDRFRFVKGEPREYRSRDVAARLFCGTCGSQLAYRNDNAESIDLGVGTLDDPDGLTPSYHVWCRSKPAWFRIDDDLPRYDKFRPGSPCAY